MESAGQGTLYVASWIDQYGIPRCYGSSDQQPFAELLADIEREEYLSRDRWDVELLTRQTIEVLDDDGNSVLIDTYEKEGSH